MIDKKLLEALKNGIESGEHITMSEYSGDPELSKAFDDGQISILELLIEWINFNENTDQ